MSAARFTLRIIVFLVTLLTIGVIFVFGFQLIDPFYNAFGEPPSGLGWGTPASTTVLFAGLGMLGLMLVLIIWFVVAPVRQDRRQQVRR